MKKYSIDKTPLQVQLEIAERLKKLRKSKKISQSKLAENQVFL